MKIYLCSKVKYILDEIKEDLSNFKNKLNLLYAEFS